MIIAHGSGVNQSLVGGSQLGFPMCLKSDGGWDCQKLPFLMPAACAEKPPELSQSRKTGLL